MNQRIELLQKRLKEWRVDLLLIENPIDLFYLTHLKLSKGRLWVWPDQAELCVDGRYFDDAKQHSKYTISLWVGGKEPERRGRIGFDSAWTTVDNLERLKKESPVAEWLGVAEPLAEQRLIKDPNEIALLQKAAKITWEGVQHIRSLFEPGIMEQDLALEFEFFVRKQGASSLAFETVVAFGENSAYPHHRASLTRLKNNQIVLIDAGAVFDSYCADMTRAYFFGEPDPRLQKMLHIVREADRVVRKEIRIGTKIGALDRVVRDSFAKAGVEKLFTHSLGHGLGLEIHERPLIRWDGKDRDMTVQPGLVIAIEPGLYQSGVGGVRYENSGVVLDTGFESFYPAE
jgi:Xaa-Pro aminopeptidase